jgi:hypothetical protein
MDSKKLLCQKALRKLRWTVYIDISASLRNPGNYIKPHWHSVLVIEAWVSFIPLFSMVPN